MSAAPFDSLPATPEPTWEQQGREEGMPRRPSVDPDAALGELRSQIDRLDTVDHSNEVGTTPD